MPAVQVEGLSINPVIVGFEWETIQQKEQSARSKEATLGKKVTYSRKIKVTGEKKVSFGSIDAKEIEELSKPVSLAAWLNASIEKNTVFAVERVTMADTENQASIFWLCVVNSGEIISGTDILGDWATINSMASDLLDVFDQDETLFVGNAVANLDVLADSDQTNESLSGVLNESRIKASTIQTSANNRLILIASLVVVVILALSVAGYMYYSEIKKEEQAKERARQQQMQRMQSARQSWAETLEDSVRRSDGKVTLDNLIGQHFMKMPPKVTGWLLKSIKCQAGECVASYENQDLSQPGFIKKAASDHCETLNVDRPGLIARCSFTYQEKASQIDVGSRDWVLKDAQWDDLQGAIMNYAKLHGDIAYSFGETQEVAFPGKGLIQGAELFDVGSYALNLPMSHYPALRSLFSRYQGMSVLKLELNANQQILSISGLIYVEDSQ